MEEKRTDGVDLVLKKQHARKTNDMKDTTFECNGNEALRSKNSGTASVTISAHLITHRSFFQQQSEAVDGLLVVLQALTQPTIVILHQPPVHDHFQLA